MVHSRKTCPARRFLKAPNLALVDQSAFKGNLMILNKGKHPFFRFVLLLRKKKSPELNGSFTDGILAMLTPVAETPATFCPPTVLFLDRSVGPEANTWQNALHGNFGVCDGHIIWTQRNNHCLGDQLPEQQLFAADQPMNATQEGQEWTNPTRSFRANSNVA